MMIVRPVRDTDLDAVCALAAEATTGLTTLPNDREFLSNRINDSVPCFHNQPRKPGSETYFFVMENVATGAVVGTSAIFAKVGGFEPFWTYEIRTALHASAVLNVRREIGYLQLKSIHNGPSEIGTLFLEPDYRRAANGRLLSLSRFLFMAEFPRRFEPRVIAEMRGEIDADGNAVFWEAVGAHFFGVPFAVADMMVTRDKSFIADLMPTHPIYIPLLPPDAQSVIGVVHEATRPARRLLEQEGFSFTNEVDIFEAGPVLGADVARLRTVRESRRAVLSGVDDGADGPVYMVAKVTSAAEFVVTTASLTVVDDGSIALPESVVAALELQCGDALRYTPLRPITATSTVPCDD